jgi:hypothetical protein
MSQDNTVNVDVKLGVNKFNVDEGHPHIILAEHPDLNEFRKLLKACPPGSISRTRVETFILILLVAWSAERVEYCAATRSSTNGNIRSEHLALIFATANGFCL